MIKKIYACLLVKIYKKVVSFYLLSELSRVDFRQWIFCALFALISLSFNAHSHH